MELESTYKDALNRTKKKLREKYRLFLEENNPMDLKKAKEHFSNRIRNELQDLFRQKTNKKDEYFFIETFYYQYWNEHFGLYGSYEVTFDKIKKEVQQAYRRHRYKRTIDAFFKQGASTIIEKMGVFDGYDEAIEEIDSKPASDWIKTSPSEFDPDEEYKNLFEDSDAMKIAEGVIDKNYRNSDGSFSFVLEQTWRKGHTVALVDTLLKFGYFKKVVKSKDAIMIFCRKHKMDISDRTARDKSSRPYVRGKREFEKQFKKLEVRNV